MKNIVKIVLLASVFTFNVYAKIPNPRFEESINQTITLMFNDNNTEVIDEKIKSLDLEDTMSKSQKTYWKTYLNYYKSIFFKTVLNDDAKATKFIEIAISLIEKATTTSEDYALLASCYSFSIQFANLIKISKTASKVEENGQKSLDLNKNNLRAYLVLATQNFHTPKRFGGMKKVESYALKGLDCPDSLNKDYYSPNWGRKRLYELLIQFYELEDRKDDLEKLKKKQNAEKQTG